MQPNQKPSSAEQAEQEAREAAERQFIGDILADDNSDYGVESPRLIVN